MRLVLVLAGLVPLLHPESHATPTAKRVARRVVFDLPPGKTAPLAYAVTDRATGKRIPAKLTFVGVKGTPNPRFSRGDIGRREPDASGVASINRVFSVDGTGELPLPLGTYDVTVSRGIEWTISTTRLEVTGEPLVLATQLEHAIETPGWASGDFHVHAEASPDSDVPMRDRVLEFVAEGVDLIVATDHDVVADYAPEIRALELGSRLASAPGDEVSTGWGHFGAFPLPAIAKRDLPKLSRMKPQQVFDTFRALGKDTIINVHHPRLEKLTGYFWIGKLDKRGVAKRKDFSYDFDAIELLNGYEDTRLSLLDRNMQDWFALLDRGVVATATGNSDSHHMTYNLGGYPRNYVRVTDDAPDKLTGADVAKGIKAHRAFFTTGPIVSVGAGTAGIGDVAPAPGGKARLDITVRAAPWISVSRVKLYIGGTIERTWTIAPASEAQVLRLSTTHDVALARDTHAVVRVEGDQPLTPVIGGAGSIAIYPVAVTNPILFDVDGNGRYDARLAITR